MHLRKLTGKWICEWQQAEGEVGQRGLSVSVFLQVKSSHVATFLLWLSPYEYFMASIWHHAQKDISCFFFPDRNPGVRVCHRGVKSVCVPQAKDGIYDAPLDDIRWIFSFLSGEPLSSTTTDKPLSCSLCVVTPLKIGLSRGRNDFNLLRVQAVFWQTVTGFLVWSLRSWND